MVMWPMFQDKGTIKIPSMKKAEKLPVSGIEIENNQAVKVSSSLKNEGRISVTGIHYETKEPVKIEIENGVICELSRPEPARLPDVLYHIAPGLIDNQLNGYAGVDFSGDDLTVEGIQNTAMALAKTGITSFLPTLITNSHSNFLKNLRILASALEDDYLKKVIPGFHLEGPYISPLEGFRGTHPVSHIRNPSWKEFSEYLETSGGRILQITMAPELKGAKAFIRECCEAGIEVAIGHSNASAEEIHKAADYGVRLSVHLGNGCANYIHRHNNPIWPQLADDRIIPSVIADGHHLTEDELKVFFRVKGPGGMILTSDITSLAGMPPGIYNFAGTEIRLTSEGALVNIEQNCLAGASFPLIHGVGHFMQVTGCSPSAALNMASKNVAAIYRLSDRGSIGVGKRADLILYEEQDNKLMIKETWLAGKQVFIAK